MNDWRRHFWRNTGSNYIRVFARMGLGLVLFRLMFQHLGEAEFGFWSLLWSLFGYGVLLDFGLGFTVQRAVAARSATGETASLSRLLATVTWTFVGLAVALFTIFALLRAPFLAGVNVPPEAMGPFGQAYLWFFIGMALAFPLGLFPEMLRGMQRLDLANWAQTGGVVLNFIAVAAVLRAGGSFPLLMALSVGTNLLPGLFCLFAARKQLQGVSLHPRLFDWAVVRPELGFSIVAYLITFSNLLMSRCDQLVLSFAIGVSAVAIYQAAYKASEMFGLFTVQLQEALSPAAAHLHARGDEAGLRALLADNSRLTFFVSTPLYALTAVFLDPLIRLLTGLEAVPAETFWAGQALLFASFSSQLTNSCSKRVLMMCGRERQLLGISLCDAVANVALSVVLVYRMGIPGVALGTMIPTVLVGWFWVLPLTLRYLNLPLGAFLRAHARGTLPWLAGFGLVLGGLHVFVPLSPNESPFLGLLWRGALCGLPLVPGFLGIHRQVRDGK